MALDQQKLLSFSLGNEEYGVSIMKVKELIGMMDITPVPKTPDFIRGVINLRGKIVPVMDLRTRFGMIAQEYDERTCIIVVEVLIKEVARTIGIVVDSVSEVINIDETQIDPPPESGSTVDADTILGIGKLREGVVIILDIDKVLLYDELVDFIEATKDGCYV